MICRNSALSILLTLENVEGALEKRATLRLWGQVSINKKAFFIRKDDLQPGDIILMLDERHPADKIWRY